MSIWSYVIAWYNDLSPKNKRIRHLEQVLRHIEYSGNKGFSGYTCAKIAKQGLT